jgi:arylsulfatase A-like enzyme
VHGLRAFGKSAPEEVRNLRPGLVTLAETFHQAGYYTAAIIANMWLEPQRALGAPRGFDHYEAFNREGGDKVNARALKLLEEVGDRPVFFYLHYMEPHMPYDSPELAPQILGPVKGGERRLPDGQVPHARHMVKKAGAWGAEEGLTLAYYLDAYDRTIYDWDQTLGRFVRWLKEHGRLDRSWISVVADHGEEIFDHGGWGHATSLLQEQMTIPWVLRAPGGKLKGRIPDPVNLLDVAPTMLAAAGLPVPATMMGHDVRNGAPKRLLFAEVDACRGDWQSCHQRVVWDGARKLFVHQKAVRVYDLQNDPGEQSPLPPDPQLVKALDDWQQRQDTLAKQFGESRPAPVDPATKERLRALGYD